MNKDLPKIEMILDSFGENEKAFYSDKIKKYKDECGCSIGSLFAITSLIIFALGNYLLLNSPSPTFVIKQILLGIFLTIIAGLLGKLIGITIARIKLVVLYKSLLRNQNNKNQ